MSGVKKAPIREIAGLVSRRESSEESSQSFVHTIGGVTTHARYPMRVSIQGHGYGRMPQKMLDEFGVNVALEYESSARVPEIMPTYPGKPARRSSGLKCRLTMF
jgi:hypothetical protein